MGSYTCKVQQSLQKNQGFFEKCLDQFILLSNIQRNVICKNKTWITKTFYFFTNYFLEIYMPQVFIPPPHTAHKKHPPQQQKTKNYSFNTGWMVNQLYKYKH